MANEKYRVLSTSIGNDLTGGAAKKGEIHEAAKFGDALPRLLSIGAVELVVAARVPVVNAHPYGIAASVSVAGGANPDAVVAANAEKDRLFAQVLELQNELNTERCDRAAESSAAQQALRSAKAARDEALETLEAEKAAHAATAAKLDEIISNRAEVAAVGNSEAPVTDANAKGK